MRTNIIKSKILLAAAAVSLTSVADAATNLITNGGFEQSTYTKNNQFGSGWNGFGGQGVTGWTGGSGYQIYFVAGTETSVNAVNEFVAPGQFFYKTFNALSSNGGNFVALDGDKTVPNGSISQILSGLTVGQDYALTFDWAASQLTQFSGDITEQLQVTFGDQTLSTNVLSVKSGQFSGWSTVTMNFTATAATQTLTFMSLGTPTGLPPIAVLDGVSMVAVPEASTWAMMLVGFAGLGGAMRYRRRTLVVS